MGFMDSLKNAAGKAAEKASQIKDQAAEMAAKAKEEAEKKKAEQEAHKAEMTAKAQALADGIVTAIHENAAGKPGIFEGYSDKELTDFTRAFAEKMFLPASSTVITRVLIYPYISAKQIKNMHNTFEFDDTVDAPLLYIKTDNGQELMLSKNRLMFKLVLPEDKKFSAVGSINAKAAGGFEFVETADGYSFRCDDAELISFKLDKKYKQDFIALNEYFSRLRDHRLEMTAEEIHQFIISKIGDVYNMFTKYFADEDEKIQFFAWGCNGLSAKDYIICTDQQVIILDRDMGGLTANATQLYYDDITSAQVIQNSNTGSLTADLINTALTAWLDVADLDLSAAGATIHIANLYKNEAERIVAIYHQMRKQLKNKSAQPAPAPAAAPANDPMEQLKKLNALKEAGILSDEEFAAKKAELLAKI